MRSKTRQNRSLRKRNSKFSKRNPKVSLNEKGRKTKRRKSSSKSVHRGGYDGTKRIMSKPRQNGIDEKNRMNLLATLEKHRLALKKRELAEQTKNQNGTLKDALTKKSEPREAFDSFMRENNNILNNFYTDAEETTSLYTSFKNRIKYNTPKEYIVVLQEIIQSLLDGPNNDGVAVADKYYLINASDPKFSPEGPISAINLETKEVIEIKISDEKKETHKFKQGTSKIGDFIIVKLIENKN